MENKNRLFSETRCKMTNLYYDLPNDILYKIDEVVHRSNTNILLNDFYHQIASDNYNSKQKCYHKLRAYCEILFYENNLSNIKKEMSMTEPPEHPIILQNRFDCACFGLSWLYDYYDMKRIDDL